MSNFSASNRISPEKEKELWDRHHIDSLLEWADVPFTRKIQMVEEMIEVARSIHGGKLPRSPDEHEEGGRKAETQKRGN